jgi:orotidine-5'-phosphate decarboxylase
VGIDPVYDRLPAALRSDGATADVEGAVAAISSFVRGVLDAVTPHVACVKFQSACFERYRWRGVQACERLINEAKSMGLMVILDAKRGDIGISAQHYAAGCLAEADALTVHSYLGADSIEPFMKVAAEDGKGLFALVRTSNPGGDAIQTLPLDDGGTVATAVATIIAELGSDRRYLGDSGYSLLGAVVGATKVDEMARLRSLMPQQIFLVPGFGAQGGSARDVKACFNADGRGALITASRSVLYAYEEAPDSANWQSAVRAAAADMQRQIQAILP